MKFVTFKKNGEPGPWLPGALIERADGIYVADLSSISPYPAAFIDGQTGLAAAAQRAIGSGTPSGLTLHPRLQTTLGPPVPDPPKIICVGLNYRDHAEESGMAVPSSPVIFSKFASCVAAPGADIVTPPGCTQLDYEAELAVVIGRAAKGVAASDAMDYVLGYMNFNDVSARDFQFADGQWVRGKSCDTFAPCGEFIATRDEVPDPHALRIRLRLNGETMQDSRTDQLIFRIPEIIEFLSRFITLEPGTIIATGTPPGVGFARKPPVYLTPGDVCEVEIDGLGILMNTVR